MILEEGLPARFERHRICADAVYNSMEALGLGLMAGLNRDLTLSPP